MENKPIKRSKSLVPLSREHHDSLLLCWKIKTGLAKNISSKRIIAYTQYFYEHFLKPHFEEEEIHVFSLLPDDNMMKQEAITHHRVLHELMDMIGSNEKPAALLKIFAKKLEEHIRFEERHLFNHIQEHVDAGKMHELGEKLALLSSNDIKEVWVDSFWEREN